MCPQYHSKNQSTPQMAERHGRSGGLELSELQSPPRMTTQAPPLLNRRGNGVRHWLANAKSSIVYEQVSAGRGKGGKVSHRWIATRVGIGLCSDIAHRRLRCAWRGGGGRGVRPNAVSSLSNNSDNTRGPLL